MEFEPDWHEVRNSKQKERAKKEYVVELPNEEKHTIGQTLVGLYLLAQFPVGKMRNLVVTLGLPD